jgi:mono/diheme cytochrome c family protein
VKFCRTVLRWSRCPIAAVALLAFGQTTVPKGAPAPAPVPPAREKPATFEHNVQPVLAAKCTSCHGPGMRVKEMDLSTIEGIMKGSESGPVVIPGKPDESRLFQMVRDGKMPPGKTRLADDDLVSIRAWIESLSNSQSNAAAVVTETAGEHDILPVMHLRCTVCHGLRRKEGGLDLRTREAMLKGGNSGPAIVPGHPEQSLILKRIQSGDMPPKKELMDVSIKVITPAETDKLTQWIAAGAPPANIMPDVADGNPDPLVSDKDREWWSFRAPKRPAVPAVKHRERVRNAVDAFTLSKLEEKGLQLSPEADRLTLMRRAYFDLTGLPPEPAEIQAFLADKDPRAYEKLIDRLLASPRYGERWGRYWLDVAGYADSEGGKLTDDVPRTYAWRYRDYVIRSFNADKPYDRFLLEQLAGDELADYEHATTVTQELLDNIVATGFLRMAPDSTIEHNISFVDDRLEVIADELDVLGSGVMGLTIRCARCHSHKYDPIPQRDYYRLKAVFKGAYDEHDWLNPHASVYDKPEEYRAPVLRFLPFIPPNATPVEILEQRRAAEELNHNLDLEIRTLKKGLEEKAAPVKKRIIDQRLAQLPAGIREDLKKLQETAADNRTEVQKYLAAKFERVLKVEPDELKSLDAGYRKEADETEWKIKKLEYRKAPDPRIRALWDRGEPSPTYIQRRGDPNSFGRLVGPGVPSCLTDGKTPFMATPPWPGAAKTGQRLALAKWLIKPDHPLTSRVMVNRIWKHHFGAGIVKTLGNFGKAGAPPTHPELLDWLATEFVQQGWSIKAMHRLMMTSSTYRQSSARAPQTEKQDPDNRLLSRMPMRRMEAEVIYDTLLLVANKLDESRFGQPEPVVIRDDGLVTPLGTEKGWHRGIYVEQRRTKLPTVMEAFDLPSMSPNCIERSTSMIAPLALHMLNDGMIAALAKSFAERLAKEAGQDPEKQVERAYWIALSRPPSVEERKISLDTLQRLMQATGGSDVPLRAATVAAKPAASGSTIGSGSSAGTALEEFCHTLMNSAAFVYID